MKTIIFCATALFTANTVIACECNINELNPVFSSEEDPLVEPGYGVHTSVSMIYFDAGDCVIVSNFVSGETESYQTKDGKMYLRFRVTGAANDMTIDELYEYALQICNKTATEVALN